MGREGSEDCLPCTPGIQIFCACCKGGQVANQAKREREREREGGERERETETDTPKPSLPSASKDPIVP